MKRTGLRLFVRRIALAPMIVAVAVSATHLHAQDASKAADVQKIDVVKASGIPPLILTDILENIGSQLGFDGLPVEIELRGAQGQLAKGQAVDVTWKGGQAKLRSDDQGVVTIKVTTKNMQGLTLKLPAGVTAKALPSKVVKVAVAGAGLPGGPGAMPDPNGLMSKLIKPGEAAPSLETTKLINAPETASVKWADHPDAIFVVEFWATHCAPCIQALPHLNHLAENLADRNVIFVSVTPDEEDALREFLARRPMKSWVAIADGHEIAESFGVMAIPQSFVVYQGKIVGAYYPSQLNERLILSARGERWVPKDFDYDRELAAIQQVEQQTQAIAPACVEATVALACSDQPGSGSGVIVSPDGLILSAAHVLGRPGQKLTVTLSDGREVEAESLGMNHDSDIGLARITTPGKWPHRPLGELDQSHVGDWCLATGHHHGLQPERSAPLRVGRILRLPAPKKNAERNDAKKAANEIGAQAMAPFGDGVRTDCIIDLGELRGPVVRPEGKCHRHSFDAKSIREH